MGRQPSAVSRQRQFSAVGLLSVLGLLAGLILTAAGPLDARSMPAVRPPARSTPAPRPLSAARDTAVFAGGCFWGIEAVYEHTRGVISAISGYSGGNVKSPSYEEVSTGTTGHAESVMVIYDPGTVSYTELLQVFFTVAHDPTQLNYQGPDHGTQYRSAIFFRNPAQKAAAEKYVADLTKAKTWRDPIVTQIVAFKAFYDAEGYHQGYLASHMRQPYIIYNDLPKLEALKNQLPQLYRASTS